MPTRPSNASKTGNPRSPGSKYAFSRCWNGQSGSWFAWPGRWTLRYLPAMRPALVDQDRGVESPLPVALADDFGVAEIEAHLQLPPELEQRCGRRVRHLLLVEGVELRLVLHPPAGEEGGQRKLGEHHEPGAPSVRFAHHLHHAGDGRGARLIACDRTHLGGCDASLSAHGVRLPIPCGGGNDSPHGVRPKALFRHSRAGGNDAIDIRAAYAGQVPQQNQWIPALRGNDGS